MESGKKREEKQMEDAGPADDFARHFMHALIKKSPMKRYSTIFFQTVFLQSVVVLIGMGAIAFLLWEPRVEGVNANKTLFEIYFKDPFVAYAYIGSIPFFVALHHAFKVLGYVRQNKTFSQATLNSLRIIKYCALALIGIVAVSVFFMIGGDREDRPAGLFMRILVAGPSIIVATTAAVFERILRNSVDIKS